ncbi:MAG: ABC transporter permease [Ignavibacteria bacterium]|nr:ABC transporter permease [Ignavibacteria bacterium]
MMSRKLKANMLSIALSLLTTIILTSILLLAIGKNPLMVYSMLISEVFGTGYGLGQAIFKATPLIICGCGLALCFQASLFNIGAEGQLNAGAFAMSIAAYTFDDYLGFGVLPFAIICGFIVSALWGLIPAFLKIKRGISEVITTIMMNFIALALVNYFLIDFIAVKSTVRTEKILDSVFIPKLSDFFGSFQGSSANLTFVFAILLAVFLYYMLYKTRFGYEIRAVGLNPTASKYLGIKTNKIIMWSFLLGAGITSLVGINFIFGYKGYYEFGFSNNLGFTSIAVTLLAKNNPIGIIFTAFLFGVLDYGGLAVNTIVPKEIMLVFQALVILSILAIDKIVKIYYLKED